MPDATSFEATFLEHVPLVERAARSVARRRGLGGDDASDFSSWIKLKLVEDNYAVLRKFRGESSIGTYLTVVVAMLARDYFDKEWGRWRPSAAASRRGALAVRLETLIYRDGYRFDHAGEVLRTAAETTLSDRELRKLFAELPVREPLRPTYVGPEPLAQLTAASSYDPTVDVHGLEAERTLAHQALTAAVGELTVEERTIVRMRFWEGLSVAEIARGLMLDQKALYRRLERLLGILRERLLASGINRHDVASVFFAEEE
jgi:RNA polymerase sigma factor for flagellar operon FliA